MVRHREMSRRSLVTDCVVAFRIAGDLQSGRQGTRSSSEKDCSIFIFGYRLDAMLGQSDMQQKSYLK